MLGKFVTSRNSLELEFIPSSFLRLHGTIQDYLDLTDALYENARDTAEGNGTPYAIEVVAEARRIFQHTNSHEAIITVIGKLVEDPLADLLATLIWFKANMENLKLPQYGLCSSLGSLTHYPQLGSLLGQIFKLWPSNLGDTWPVEGSNEAYQASIEAGTIWTDPRRLSLLDFMIEELQVRGGSRILKCFANPFWLKSPL